MAPVAYQPYVTGKQSWSIQRLIGKVDVIVTDSPTIMGLVYSKEDEHFEEFVAAEFKSRNNLNVFINRTCDYDFRGRYQDEQGAKDLDRMIEGLLKRHNINYMTIDGNKDAARIISDTIVQNLSSEYSDRS